MILNETNLHTTCPLCKRNRFFEPKTYFKKCGLVKCKNCSFVFMQKIPQFYELEKIYSSYSYAEDAFLPPLTVKSYETLLDEFEKFRLNNKILDVGCGRGWFLEIAKNRGWEVFGTEYSETAIKICENKGINIKKGFIDSSEFEGIDFDIITSFEVIEHISFPEEYVFHIHKLLRKNGLFYITTPNFNSIFRYYKKANYHIIEYPEHLSYFTKKTLTKLLKDKQFTKEKIYTSGISLVSFQNQEKAVCCNSAEHPDQKLRNLIEKNFLFSLAKVIVNFILKYTNLGVTIKSYFIKK